MTFDADDLPQGYVSAWDSTLTHAQLRAPVGRPPERDMSKPRQRTRTDGKRHSAAFYARARLDPEWVAKRNAWKRAAYARKAGR